MKTIWIIANWKSNKSVVEALDWVSQVGPNIPKNDPPAGGLRVVVCPPFSCLSEVKKAVTVNNFPIMVGSQDLSSFGVGAYTGEESAALLKDLVEISIIGHSERRQNFLEDDEMIAKKSAQAIQNNIIPLVCVQGADIPVPEGCKLVAYEPVLAIGTGNPDTPENASRVADLLKEKYGAEIGVIYGGSVTSANAKGFIEQENIEGVLVGNASLDADEFSKIIESLEG